MASRRTPRVDRSDKKRSRTSPTRLNSPDERGGQSSELADEALRNRIVELERENEDLKREVVLVRQSSNVGQQSLDQIFDSLPGLLCTLTPDMQVDYVNRPLLDYFGINLQDVQDWKFGDLVHPDDLEPLIAENRQAANTGAPYIYERRCKRHDGVFRWLQMRGHPLTNEHGEIIRWYSLLFDIEDRKQAEQALLESEQKFRRIINSMPMLVWSADVNGSADFFNDKWLAFTGMQLDEALGWGWSAAVHPDDYQRTLSHWQTLLNAAEHDEPTELEVRFRRHDGHYRWFLVRASAYRDANGVIVNWFGTNTDIHDRKVAEDNVRRSETTLLEAQRIARMGSFARRVSSKNIHAHEITWSEGLYRIFEVERGTPINFNMMAQRIHPDDIPMWWNRIVEAQKASSNFDTEIRLVMPSGATKYISISAYLTHDLEGNPEYIGTVQDFTERRLAEDALNRAQLELAQTMRVASLGVLTAAIAHEINQPLSAVVTNASTSVRMLTKNPPQLESALQTARHVIRDANRASEVTARLRNLLGQKGVKMEAVDLNEATREIIDFLRGDMRRCQIALHEELASDLPTLNGDRVQLQQVILNLLRNAIDAIEATTKGPRTIRIRTESASRSIELSVEDSGAGFDQLIADQMFGAFFTTKTQGMGIGLSVSRSIIEAHQGSLWATNNPVKGATFRFRIPTDL
jgi:PAS domain S-box-containing protein